MTARRHPRVPARALASVMLVAGLVAPQTVRAQGPYTFTRIADTNSDPVVAGAYCVGLSDRGTVVAVLQGAVWQGHDHGSFAVVASNVGLCASINDFDEIAYIASNVPAVGQSSLLKNAGGVLTTLARSAELPYLGSGNYLPSLNNRGQAVFVSTSPGYQGIYLGPGAVPVYTDGTLNTYSSPASLNDAQQVVFGASRIVNGQARHGIYVSSSTPFIESGAALPGGTLGILFGYRPVINNAGVVAFVGTTDGTPTVFTSGDGVTANVVGTRVLDQIAINDRGSSPSVAKAASAAPSTLDDQERPTRRSSSWGSRSMAPLCRTHISGKRPSTFMVRWRFERVWLTGESGSTARTRRQPIFASAR